MTNSPEEEQRIPQDVQDWKAPTIGTNGGEGRETVPPTQEIQRLESMLEGFVSQSQEIRSAFLEKELKIAQIVQTLKADRGDGDKDKETEQVMNGLAQLAEQLISVKDQIEAVNQQIETIRAGQKD
jgi:predicted transcriptional regulator